MADHRTTLSRVPPHNEDAEAAVLGAVLQDPKALPYVRAVIGPEHVYLQAPRGHPAGRDRRSAGAAGAAPRPR